MICLRLCGCHAWQWFLSTTTMGDLKSCSSLCRPSASNRISIHISPFNPTMTDSPRPTLASQSGEYDYVLCWCSDLFIFFSIFHFAPTTSAGWAYDVAYNTCWMWHISWLGFSIETSTTPNYDTKVIIDSFVQFNEYVFPTVSWLRCNLKMSLFRKVIRLQEQVGGRLINRKAACSHI